MKTFCASSYHAAEYWFVQIKSNKEIEDKKVAVVHLDQKGIEDHQDWLG